MKKLNVKVILLVIIMLVLSLSLVNIKNVSAEEGTDKKVAVISIKENKTSNQKQELSKGEQINERLEKLTEICKNVSGCAKEIEEQGLKKYPNLVKREGNKLYLQLNNSKNLVLEDNLGNKDPAYYYKSYLFQDFVEEINSYLLLVSHYEMTEMIYINKYNGEITSIIGLINYYKYSKDRPFIFNSNINKFISYKCNLDGDIHGIDIHKYENNKIIKEYSDGKAYIENAVWLNNNTIELTKCSYNEKDNGTIYYLKFQDSKWIETDSIN